MSKSSAYTDVFVEHHRRGFMPRKVARSRSDSKCIYDFGNCGSPHDITMMGVRHTGEASAKKGYDLSRNNRDIWGVNPKITNTTLKG